MLQTGKRTRFFYLDILKIIAIFLVIFCHYQTVGNTILDNMAMTICYIAVPVFFMVNGALLFNKSFDLKKHIKKQLHFTCVHGFGNWFIYWMLFL